FSSRRRHTRFSRDWSSDVCSSDLNFPFEPTQKQDIFFSQISEFVSNSSRHDIFILKGYAGTGKTTIISTVVNHLGKIGKKSVLLAPTGRAAKVISNYSGKTAFTIHKK